MYATMRRRWSDNDRYFGPLTFAYDPKYRHTALMLASGDDEYRGASLRLSLGGATVILALPDWLLPPQRRWVDTSRMPYGVVEGRGYHAVTRREFGFSLSDTDMVGGATALHVHFGAQTHDSSTDKSKCYFLPWTDWRHVRHSLYGLDGEHFADMPQNRGWRVGDDGAWRESERIEASCPTATFAFKDFDGEALTVTTRIEEREWRRGTGRFKWLAWFSKPIVHRSLDLHFSGETGKRKGSWKGGTIGHAIAMQPGELHESAFRRYCDEHDMTFVSA